MAWLAGRVAGSLLAAGARTLAYKGINYLTSGSTQPGVRYARAPMGWNRYGRGTRRRRFQRKKRPFRRSFRRRFGRKRYGRKGRGRMRLRTKRLTSWNPFGDKMLVKFVCSSRFQWTPVSGKQNETQQFDITSLTNVVGTFSNLPVAFVTVSKLFQYYRVRGVKVRATVRHTGPTDAAGAAQDLSDMFIILNTETSIANTQTMEEIKQARFVKHRPVPGPFSGNRAVSLQMYFSVKSIVDDISERTSTDYIGTTQALSPYYLSPPKAYQTLQIGVATNTIGGYPGVGTLNTFNCYATVTYFVEMFGRVDNDLIT